MEDLVNVLEIGDIDTPELLKTLNGQSRLKSELFNG